MEQNFNSLHAQREACEAFIKSQKHEGWEIDPTPYDDGGKSGATMERPALQRLLAGVRSGRTDVVVIYKIDRLTRSLADFAKIVEIFDAHGISFVSVTQQFNTTTSMGRLTLNVLLSFAQFEREVTGERIRDKIAASKKKGMWMGGCPPLGYDVQDKMLIVIDGEAETVRHIFRRYVELGSVHRLMEALNTDGIVSKIRVSQAGRRWGGKPFTRGGLYLMLQNRHYIGEITHRDDHYPGQHNAIVCVDLWAKVQAKLAANRVDRKTGGSARYPSLLAGLLFDGRGRRMTPSHAVKKGKRYRYYVSQPLTTRSRDTVPGGRRIPAADIERLVIDRIKVLLADPAEIYEALQPYAKDATGHWKLVERATELTETWTSLSPAQIRSTLIAVVSRIDVKATTVDVHLVPARLHNILEGDLPDRDLGVNHSEVGDRMTLSIPARLKRAGKETRMIIDGAGPHMGRAEVKPSLIKLIVRAHALQRKVLEAGGESLVKVAEREGLTGSYFTRLLRMAFLSPGITEAILEGRQPLDLTAAKLIEASRLPLDWQSQENMFGFS